MSLQKKVLNVLRKGKNTNSMMMKRGKGQFINFNLLFVCLNFRNRASEAGISIDYLKNLQNAYEEYIKEISRVCPVIRVNWSEFKTVEVKSKIFPPSIKLFLTIF